MPNNFKEAIARCKDPDYRYYSPKTAARIEIERKMVSAVVRHALAQGWTVSVNDGEEWTLVKSASYEAIFDALFTTDMDTIMLRRADGSKVGWFQLIYGNDGYDVVADYGVNDDTDLIWNTVIMPLADKLEAGR